MNKEELIKKLEQVETPTIENPNHKERLRATLIDWKYNKKQSNVFVNLLIPVGSLAIVVFLVLVVSTPFFFQGNDKKINKILTEDPNSNAWIKENNAEVKDIEIVGDKAYIFLSSPKDSDKNAVIEVDLKQENVSDFEEFKEDEAPTTSGNNQIEVDLKTEEIKIKK